LCAVPVISSNNVIVKLSPCESFHSLVLRYTDTIKKNRSGGEAKEPLLGSGPRDTQLLEDYRKLCQEVFGICWGKTGEWICNCLCLNLSEPLLLIEEVQTLTEQGTL